MRSGHATSKPVADQVRSCKSETEVEEIFGAVLFIWMQFDPQNTSEHPVGQSKLSTTALV